MRVVDLILKKRHGEELSYDELKYLIDGYVKGDIPDYQVSAWLMAVVFQGLSLAETTALTQVMLESGEALDLSSIKGLCVDKHSTGGVGDTTTLIVAPLAAACGLKVAKMSGRGLGHTGGTLDKLEAIPGFKIELTPEAFFKQVNEIGLAVVGQTANITPADKKLYALRDVTGTVEAMGLIASSIMSKKLASGAQYIILDVKVGDGAFMKDLDSARHLAEIMVHIGKQFNRKVVAVLTNMDEPLGVAIGNANEVQEAIDVLSGQGPADIKSLATTLVSELLVMTGEAKSLEAAQAVVNQKLNDGSALHKLREMIQAQGGNPDVIDHPELFPGAAHVLEITAHQSGYVSKINTESVGGAAMLLGAGRATTDASIDLGVGVFVDVKVGDYVHQGDVIARISANDQGAAQAQAILHEAIVITTQAVQKLPLIYEIVR